MEILNVEQMRAMDKKAIEEYKIPEIILMENASIASTHCMENWLEKKKNKIMIFCGSGNNGGDGLALARKLHSLEHEICVILLSSPEKLRESARLHYDVLKTMNILIDDFEKTENLETRLTHTDIIVDAMLGTGIDRPVGGKYAEAIELINRMSKKIISLDIPSGVNGDTGKIMGTAIQAHKTISFGLPKAGNIFYPGFSNNGKLYVSHISFPPELRKGRRIKVKLNRPKELPKRSEEGHKGSFGKALFIAGSSQYLGAPYFAAYSFLKSGGGYSRLAAPELVTQHVSQSAPELVLCPQNANPGGGISKNSFQNLLELSEVSDVVVIGPGLGLDKETQELCQKFIKSCPKPLIIDGDALTALAQKLELLKKRQAPSLLTPHRGEMKRFIKNNQQIIDDNYVQTVMDFCETYNSYLILKGPHSLIGSPDRQIRINMSGNSAMATAGSGDVLTGLAAALLCLFHDMEEAASCGAFLHGMSGDLAARRLGKDGVTAKDIMNTLPKTLRLYRQTPKSIIQSYEPKVI